jgi:RimJ/RimL family protein N-acetyltransferase
MRAISLVQLSPDGLAALARGDLEAARRCFPFRVGDYFIGPECLRTWRLREAQIAGEPEAAGWVTRFIVDPSLAAAVGRAGFHGPPDAEGRVEVGYSVDPVFRRRGYARAALLALLDWARSDPSIQTVRASIAPGNLASRQLVDAHGFIEVGEQWDDEDGLEMIFEVNRGGF